MVPGQTECPWATRDGWGVATLFAPHPGVLCDLGGAAPLWRPGWVCRDPEVWGCRPGALLPAPSPPDRGLSVLGPRGLAGASRSGSPRGPHSHSCPSQLRTTAAGPRLCRGVNGALAGRGPTSARRGPERSDRQCAGLVASTGLGFPAGQQHDPADPAAQSGPGAQSLVSKSYHRPQPAPSVLAGVQAHGGAHV